MMRFYKPQPDVHQFYCGIDLHARTLYLCVLDHAGKKVLHKEVPSEPAALLEALAPYRQGLVIAAECMFAWYWVADLCAREQIAFVLGHALYMKSIHGAKAKNDRIDSEKIANLLRGGNLPQAYVYPHGLRETRDLLRRRMFLVHQRAELITHIQTTNAQYNLPPFGQKLIYAKNRQALKIAERFEDASVRKSMAVNLALIDCYEELIADLELHLQRTVKVDDANTYFRLQSIPGVGPILGLVLLYEVHDVRRFATVGDFISYARLVRPDHESAGKKCGFGKKKIGNAHLRWALGEAVTLMLRQSDQAKRFVARLEKKRGKGKALGILAAKLGRAVYWMLRRQEAFDVKRFWRN
jgi:transposase